MVGTGWETAFIRADEDTDILNDGGEETFLPPLWLMVTSCGENYIPLLHWFVTRRVRWLSDVKVLGRATLQEQESIDIQGSPGPRHPVSD